MSFPKKFVQLVSLAATVMFLMAALPALADSLALGMQADGAAPGAPTTTLIRSSFNQIPGTERVTTAVDCDDTGCPSGQPADLDKCVERTKFCVYYTTASITETEAEWAADTIQSYWDRFVSLGFHEPKYSDQLRVELTNVGGCNGGTGWDSPAMDTYAGCFDVTLLAQKVLGHELTHRMQYAYDTSAGAPIQTKFLKEGTARATEDNWFNEIDDWAAALSHSSFNTEANNYLLAVHNDITSYDMRYKSCLWWKYGMEQYGTTSTEPQLGIDFVEQVLLQNTAGYSGVAAVNRALNAMGTGTNFNESFQQFAVAIYTKDLTGLPGSSYNFIDEEETGNPAVYGPLVPIAGGTIEVGTTATWNNQGINSYGLHYYQANIGSNCPLISASFHRDDAGPAFYHVVTQNGTVLNTHVQGSGADWTQAFIDDGVTKVTAIVGSLGNSSLVDVSLGCADPVVEIIMPNSVALARVQSGTRFLAQVQVTNGSTTGPVVAGLTNDYFRAEVGGATAAVVGGGFIQEQYWLLIQAPDLPDDTYDLEITLQEPGGAPLDSDTNTSSVLYTSSLTDQVLIIDRSGSMGVGDPQRLSAAKDAAAFYVDVTRDDDGLAVVPYNGDVVPPLFNIQTVDATVRAAAKTYINSLVASGMTSIGDGLKEALNQIKSSETENELCSLVLLSDGMENTAAFWADVRTDIIGLGCPVTTIAFGPETDETLLQSIAEETGGLYFYNDVYTSVAALAPEAIPSDMALDLGSTYEYAESLAEFRQRLLAEKGVVSAEIPEVTHHVLVDETISEIVFSLDWPKASYGDLDLFLMDPDGNKYTPDDPGYAFEDGFNSHVGYRLTKFTPGRWEITVQYNKSEFGEVPYQVLVSARSAINFELMLPDRLGLKLTTGMQIPLYAILSGKGPIPDADVLAWVTSPNGAQVMVPLLDDGQHDDGASGDGLYGGLYTAINQAEAVKPTGEDDQSVPNDEGSYRVLAKATHKEFQREAIGAFSVLEGVDEPINRLPDIWEKIHGVSDPEGDPDHDLLINYYEYTHGTDPNDSDSDDGGENDGSEVTHGRDPLDPSDDVISAPEFLQVQPWIKSVVLRFDAKPNYDFLRLFRSEEPDGKLEEIAYIKDPFGTSVYTDTLVVNGTQYFYLMQAGIIPTTITGEDSPQVIGATEIVSALLTSEGVTPSEDPILPEGHVLINQDDPLTTDLQVKLTFIPYEGEGSDALQAFEDIAEVKISNRPDFAGAVWQTFTQNISWTLDAALGEIATVYVLFKDKSGNVSISPESDSILYQYYLQYLPVINK